MSGTVNVARALWDDPTFKDSEMSQREAWIWMIAEASWKARVKRVGNVEVSLARGQLAASTRFLAQAWQWSEPRVRRYLDVLENRRMIQRATDAGVTVISICKYDDYQSAPRVSDAVPTHQPTQQRRTTDANENKGEIREYVGDTHEGGAASESSAAQSPSEPSQTPAPETLRERILDACGVIDVRSGIIGPTGRAIGTQADMVIATRWIEDLGLGESEVVQVVREVMASKRDGPPASFAYFNPAMKRLAGAKRAAPLDPQSMTITEAANGLRKSASDVSGFAKGSKRPDPALERIARLAGIG